MKKILWLCNIVLPDFSQEFAIKRNNFGGWMTGMLHGLEKEKYIEVSLCFPIRDKNRLKDGKCNGHSYYTFLCDAEAVTYTDELVQTFEDILERGKPDLVHIWGTEYPHTTAMLLACKNKGILDKAVINIQGLVSVYSRHYLSGIPDEYITWKKNNGTSIEEEWLLFKKRGNCEIESIKMAHHVIGRTDWDRACVEVINPQIEYHFCGEILRDIFYEYAGDWNYNACQKHTIFVSQATYPIKGFHFLLKALPFIINKFPDTSVYVAGTNILNTKIKGSYAYYIEKLIKTFDLEDRIFFLGTLSEAEMIQQYLNANVFVLPSSIENSPNSLKEAKLLGVPSVVSFVGGAYSGSNVGSECFFYPYNEPEVLAYYICETFQNKNNICTKLSENSTASILKFSVTKNCINQNMEIYRKILDKSF